MDCSPTLHRISQARILDWVVISFSWGSSQPKDGTHASCIAGKFSTAEPLGKPQAGGMHDNITMKMILFNFVSLSRVTRHIHKHSLNRPCLPFWGWHYLYLHRPLGMPASWWQSQDQTLSSGSELVTLMTTTRRRNTKWLIRGPEWQMLSAVKIKNKDKEDGPTKWFQMTEVWLSIWGRKKRVLKLFGFEKLSQAFWLL